MEARGAGGGPDPPWVPMPGVPLDEQARLFGGIAMSSPEGVVASDLDGRVVWANLAAAEMFGWSPEELLGRPIAALLPERAQALTGERLLDDEPGGTFTTTGLRQDGETFNLTVTLRVRRDDDGRPVGAGLILRETTDEMLLRQKLAEAERHLASREAFFRGLNREASDVTLVTDSTGNLRYVTPSVKQVLGYEPDQLLDVLAGTLAHSDDLVGQQERRRLIREAPGAKDRGTVRFQDAAGRWRWFELTVTNCLEDPDIAGIVVNLREVTPEIEAQHALRESEARYRAIVETAQEGILAVSPEGDVLFANRRLTEIVGLSMREVYALSRRGLFAPERSAEAARRLAGRPREAGPERSDLPYRHPDGGDRVLHVSASALTAADGSVIGSLAMVFDVTEQRAAEDSLRRQALHDPLTGLPNRLLFVDRLNTAAARQDRAEDSGLAVLFLDLDHFKLVNDTHGHQTGDRVLVEVAARLAQAVRAADTVARLGGDEFAVICEGADAASAALVASRIQQAFKGPVLVGEEPFEVSLSIGVALSPPHEAEDLLRLADMAMYQAKATTGEHVVTYQGGGQTADPRLEETARAADETSHRSGR